MSIRVQVGKKRGKENEKKNDDQEEVQSPLKKSKSSPVKNGKTTENQKKIDDEEEVQSPLKKSKSSPVKNGKTTKWIEFFWLKMVQSQSGFENKLWKFKKIKDVSNVELFTEMK